MDNGALPKAHLNLLLVFAHLFTYTSALNTGYAKQSSQQSTKDDTGD